MNQNSKKPNIYDITRIFWVYDEDLNSKSTNKLGKKRPCVITAFTSDGKAILHKITTKYDEKPEIIKIRYYKIKDLKIAGLNRQSYIDIFNPRTIPLVKLKNRIKGELSIKDILGLVDFKKKYPIRLKNLEERSKKYNVKK